MLRPRALTTLLLLAFLAQTFLAPLAQARAAAAPPPGAVEAGLMRAALQQLTQLLGPGTPPPPPPVMPHLTPLVDPHLPSLSLHLDFSDDTVSVGDLLTVTLTVANRAPDPAVDLVVTMPVPANAVAEPPLGSAWSWTQSRLEPGVTVTFSAGLRVASLPPGRALLLTPSVTARGLPQPVATSAGVVVTPRGPVTGRFSPGAPAVLRSLDTATEAHLPANVFSRALTLRHAPTPLHGVAPPQPEAAHRGFAPFFLDATDDSGQPVHQFAAPLTLIAAYTPEQLAALDIVERDLTLRWYDDTRRSWVDLPTQVDPAAHTATAQVDHFSAFALGDGSSPSAAFLPSLQGWQVGLYTGAASYNYGLDMPAGPGGLKPSLSLSYSSAATDGAAGQQHIRQAGWVGQGWSLDPGSISLQKVKIDEQSAVNYYSLVLNGQSFDLTRGNCLPNQACGNQLYIDQWDWHPTDESFMRARAVWIGWSDATRGGYDTNGAAYPRYKWQIWAKDGTMYEYGEDLWWGFQGSNCAYGYMEPYKWQLSRVQDTHGNVIIYNYARQSETRTGLCYSMHGVMDGEIWLTGASWAGNLNTGTDPHYQVLFDSAARTNDTDIDWADNQIGPAPQQSRQLNAVLVYSRQAATWDLARAWSLSYDYSLLSDYSQADTQARYNADPATEKLTLKLIRRVDRDVSTYLPDTTFTYGLTRGTNAYPQGSWNRLITVNNGQGGAIMFAYETIGAALIDPAFVNYRRVTSKTVTDGRGGSYVWTYAYTHPALNWLGTEGAVPQTGGCGLRDCPNAATVYYANYYSAYGATQYVAHKPLSEFRGHSRVVEHDPNGNEIEHLFYQGDAGCNPTSTSDASGTCFQQLRDREFQKGREYQTTVYTGAVAGGAAVSQARHSFSTAFYDYGTYQPGVLTYPRATGLWRAFVFENQTTATACEGNCATGKSQTTTNTYDLPYGNLHQTREYDANNALLRWTDRGYINRDDSAAYIVDRLVAEVVYDGQNRFLAHSFYFYDGSHSYGALGTIGDLTGVRKLYDLPQPPTAGITGLTLHGADTTYTYDAYGNPQTVTTYTGGSVAVFNGSSWSFTEPHPSTARTTTNTYDPIFHSFLTQVDPPAVNGVTLTEQAGYDYRMGTLTSVTDPNGNVTTATYDGFGRLSTIVQPGDSPSVPTTQVYYYDWEQPVRYLVARREQPGDPSAWRPLQQFYDGLGRLIQSKGESVDGAQSVVADKQYDGMGQVTRESQLRYVNETPSTTFWQYVAPPPSGVNWTSTSYDGQGRPLTVTAPDNTTTTFSYSLQGTELAVTTEDARHHKTRRESDVFGRLVRVREYSGEAYPWTLYATTTYGYSPLDLLTSVTDTNNNVTTLSYDSLGRKTSMRDPDMGAWTYQYDATGKLLDQLSPRGQHITFSYDALDRLTAKNYPQGWGDPTTYLYDQAAASNGKGRRTGATTAEATLGWQYDARGRVTRQDYTTGWLAGTYSFAWSYDSADRPSSLTYPSGEVVSYIYDAAWRPTSACASLGGCYAANAQYSALDQPASRTLGNGVSESWTYSGPLARLQRLQAGAALDRSYGYDPVGNVTSLVNNLTGDQQSFTYDHRDRLTRWTSADGINPIVDQSYGYDALGNLTSKAGVSYSYGPQAPYNGGPHAALSGAWSGAGSAGYGYDAAGNLTGGPGRSLTWYADNTLMTVSSGGGTEQYFYDPDGERLARSHGGLTTVYMAGLLEVDEQTGTPLATRTLYAFNGAVIAERNSAGGSLVYLHGDHLGSVAAATTASGGVLSHQEFDPWGTVRAGTGVSQTSLNYTGQRRDDTGLLYYHARYYDPALARWTSPDAIVPWEAQGSSGSAATLAGTYCASLVVDFHQANFDARWAAHQGPLNPQALNRYSYVLNNPVRYTDPTGHANAVPPDSGAGDAQGLEEGGAMDSYLPERYRVYDNAQPQFGRDVQWGSGQGSAAGLDSVSQDIQAGNADSRVEEVSGKGLTPEELDEAARFYDNALAKNPRAGGGVNGLAGARARYLRALAGRMRALMGKKKQDSEGSGGSAEEPADAHSIFRAPPSALPYILFGGALLYLSRGGGNRGAVFK